jgi:hypothetical protein
MLRRIFGPNRENVPGESWELLYEEFIKYSLHIRMIKSKRIK